MTNELLRLVSKSFHKFAKSIFEEISVNGELFDEKRGVNFSYGGFDYKMILEIERTIDCRQCKNHNLDWYPDDYDEFEVCDKGHELEPSKCDDYEEL